MSSRLTIFAVDHLPEVEPGADLARLIIAGLAQSRETLVDGDVVVVTHKIVSKAEGQLVRLDDVRPSALAIRYAQANAKDPRQVEVVLREAVRIVRMDRGIIIAETRHGFVCANAGVDASNAPPGTVCLLPRDPDASARRLQQELGSHFGIRLAVVISDSFGRPWRNGIVNVAIGLAGMDAFADYRGQVDPHGHELKVSVLAVADELAAAAELVMGKLDRHPVAVIRGYHWTAGDDRAAYLVMDVARDLFR
ncbi:MAG: coenzyme F420-0:L-glutamate ligase [Chloroflexi bacterium]|nr:coenzyme F420-0:L-glutamate ligase [Chloroflexota bacterium]